MLSHSTSPKFFPLGQSLNEAVVHAIFGGSTLLTWNGTKIESHHRGDSKLHWMCTPKLKICAGQGPASPLHSGLRIFPNCSCASRNVSSHPGTETHNSSKISTQNKKDIWALKKTWLPLSPLKVSMATSNPRTWIKGFGSRAGRQSRMNSGVLRSCQSQYMSQNRCPNLEKGLPSHSSQKSS